MGKEFITWAMFEDYMTFVSIVLMLVEFSKELPLIRNIKTKFYSAGVSTLLIILVNLHAGTFALWDLVLYIVTGIVISLTANGLKDYNKVSR